MQFIYRGIAYQSISADSANAKQQTNLKYRGISYQSQKVEHKKIAGVSVLKYRGIDFIKIINN